MIRLSEIAAKKMINIDDGRDMGQLHDFEIDPVGGRIQSLIVPLSERNYLFRRREYRSIPWQEIKKIGHDVILIENSGRSIPDYMIEGYHS